MVGDKTTLRALDLCSAARACPYRYMSVVFQVAASRTGAGNVVTLFRELPTPAGPSPIQMAGRPKVSFPLRWPIHAETPVPSSSSCVMRYVRFGFVLLGMEFEWKRTSRTTVSP